MRNLFYLTAAIFVSALLSNACHNVSEPVAHDGFSVITQKNGPTLSYCPEAGTTILHKDGQAFKDHNRNGELDPFEDWRLSPEKRAEDLVSRMDIEDMAGLMTISNQQHLPRRTTEYATYGGLAFDEAGVDPWAIQDHQYRDVEVNRQRNFLVQKIEASEYMIRWNNEMQKLVEGKGHGIPMNLHTDPRYFASAVQNVEYLGGGGRLSLWPTHLGFAATFDPATTAELTKYMSDQYRALGVATALSPQIDLGTEPRWKRFDSTYGEGTEITTDICFEYVYGFQATPAEEGIYTDEGYLTGRKALKAARKAGNGASGWGFRSIATMAKHWPGGGTGEAGRDAHFSAGKYAVYPGKNFEEHTIPFKKGAFNESRGKIGVTSAIMPYYTISYGVDTVANGFSRHIIQNLLREGCSYDGIVCTDWLITEEYKGVRIHYGKPWGVELKTKPERYYIALYAGCDQFGGVSEIEPILGAYKIWVENFGEESARQRFELSAKRLLLNFFRTGIFENPYRDVEESMAILNDEEAREAGLDVQRKSVVMLKNSGGALPVAKKTKVYVPEKLYPHVPAFFTENKDEQERIELPVELKILEKFYEFTSNPDEAEFAIVFIDNPNGGYGFDYADVRKGGNGYLPISLQYGPYKAEHAREVSMAGGDPLEKSKDRSYKGKSQTAWNYRDADLVKETREKMGEKPVVVVVSVDRPFVPGEWEKYADAILVDYRVERLAILQVMSGEYEPSGLLPHQMPADMKTVELQDEDVARDMTPYVDEDGNVYDYAFGLNWSGVITDWRTEKYK